MSDNAVMTDVLGKLMNITDLDCLDRIENTAFNRKRDLRQRNAAVETSSWMVNDDVQMLPEHRSRKPYGAIGKIVKINKVKIVVDFEGFLTYNVPKSMLMKSRIS